MADIPTQLAEALRDRYVLERELGRGGMATVYLAHDLKHDRRVAIKVMRPELAAVIGAERFLAEIKTTANLQHPHLLPLYDSGEADGFLFYVMPYVEGESLRDRLTREKQLPIADAVRIATEVGSALDYAHRHGIIHRDIKPGNVLLHDGRALVADFGIALATDGDHTRMTETGLSLGTPRYMSPEQAMGERVLDARSDVYALGAMTYEMLTGDPPFTGGTAQAIVAKVLTEKPVPPTRLRDTIPKGIEDTVLTALAKLPADRFPTAAAFSASLADESGARGSTRTVRMVAVTAPAGPWRRIALGAIPVAAMLALAVGLGWLRPTRSAAPGMPWRVDLGLPDSTAVAQIAISADGATLAYGGQNARGPQIYLRRADAPVPVAVAGTEGGRYPAISPDGRRIAFLGAGGTVRVVPVGGGTAITVSDSAVFNDMIAWSDDDHLVFGTGAGLVRVATTGGALEPLTRVNRATGEGYHLSPDPLPGGQGVVFTITSAGSFEAAAGRIGVVGPGGGPHTVLTEGFLARFEPPGHLLVLRPGGIVAFPFDPAARRLTGPAVPVVPGLRVGTFTNAGSFAVARTGRLIYLAGDDGIHSHLVRVERNGAERTVDSTWSGNFRSVANSPDGRHAAVGIYTDNSEEIQVRDLRTGGLVRIGMPGAQARQPVFSPDGASIFFAALGPGLTGIYRAAAGGVAPPQRLFGSDLSVADAALSPDGHVLYYATYRANTGDIYAHVLDRPGTRDRAVVATSAYERSPAPSPDGRWLAYVSDESGRSEVYVQPAEEARAERWQISRAGVPRRNRPRWSRDGRELFYFSADSLVAARLASGPAFRVAEQRSLFPTDAYAPNFDLLPDGAFLMIRVASPQPGAVRAMMLERWDAVGAR